MITNSLLTYLGSFSLLLMGGYLVSFHIKKCRFQSLLLEIAEDNNIRKEKTKIKGNIKKCSIIDYKKIPTETLEKIPSVLTDETGKRFVITRRPNKIILEQFPSIPKNEGVYSQNVQNGNIKPFRLEDLKNWNGLMLYGKSGVGKSMIVSALINGKNTKIFSPKGNKDFSRGQRFSIQMLKDIRELVENYENLEVETWIVIDEIITFMALAKKHDKELLELISINLTLNRDSKLKYILITQKMNKDPLLDLGLINYKLINHNEISNFTKTLGISNIKTKIQTLKVGQFLLFSEDGEYLIQNNISKEKSKKR